MVAVTLVHHSQNSFEFVLQKEQRIFFSTLRLLLLSTTTSALGSIEVTSVKNILCARKEFVFDQLLPPIISDTLVTGMLGSVITIVRTKNTGLHSGLMPSKAELNALQSGSPTNCNPAANLTKHRGLCSWQPSLHCRLTGEDAHCRYSRDHISGGGCTLPTPPSRCWRPHSSCPESLYLLSLYDELSAAVDGGVGELGLMTLGNQGSSELQKGRNQNRDPPSPNRDEDPCLG